MTKYISQLPLPIGIIGMGLSGESVFNLLLHEGFNQKDLLCFDDKAPGCISSVEEFLSYQPKTLVVSPGFPLRTPWLKKQIEAGAFLTSELSIAASYLTSEKVVGITCSLGKSTTVSLLGEMTKYDDPHAFVGGNLGLPFCHYALRLAKGGPKAQFVVLELSSYQLENLENIKFDAAGLTFLSPNHLERYENLNHYYNTKLRLATLAATPLWVNENGGDAKAYTQAQGLKVHFVSTKNPLALASYNFASMKLLGSHNHDNLALAIVLGQALGLSASAIHQAFEFRGLPHRLESLGELRGVHIVNDSKATAMDSVLIAVHSILERLQGSEKVFLLLGGRDKNLPWRDLQVLKNQPALQPLLFGECRETIQSVFEKAPRFKTLKEAVAHAASKAQSGDYLLLSPGGTSLDEFKSFEDRGRQFANYVKDFFGS